MKVGSTSCRDHEASLEQAGEGRPSGPQWRTGHESVNELRLRPGAGGWCARCQARGGWICWRLLEKGGDVIRLCQRPNRCGGRLAAALAPAPLIHAIIIPQRDSKDATSNLSLSTRDPLGQLHITVFVPILWEACGVRLLLSSPDSASQTTTHRAGDGQERPFVEVRLHFLPLSVRSSSNVLVVD